MQHNYHFKFLFVALLGLCTGPVLYAATITVTSTADTGEGSLRAAVMMAAAGDEIVFAPQTNGQSIGLMSVIEIRKDLIIRGNGRKVTMIDGNRMSRAFSVLSGATVMMYDLLIKNGREFIGGGLRVRAGATLKLYGVQVDGCEAFGARFDRGGGAVYNQGNFYMTNSVLSNNTALGRQGSGGAIFNAPGGMLEIAYSWIRDNQANRAGGGIEDASGSGSTVTITESNINTNTVFDAPGNGGGIHIGSDGDVTIVGGTVDQNKAGAEGGGIWNGAGTLTVSNTLVRMNEAMGDEADQGGGGLYNNGNGTIILKDNARVMNNKATGTSGSGGGILNNTGATLLVTNSQVSGNEANRAGGGIEDASGSGSPFTITDSKVNQNVVFDAPGNGGGIHIGGDGSLTVDGGTVNENTAGAEGGGIWNNTGTLTVKGNASIFGNVALGDEADQGGGGLYNNGGGTIVVSENVQILENKATGLAGSGGGILNNTGATLNIYDSRIAGNEANRAGGGIEDASGSSSAFTIVNAKITDNVVYDAPGNGGGIHIGGDGSLSVTGGTVNDNTAGAEGGGIWNNTGTLAISGTEIRGNVALGNDADQGGGGLYNNGGGTIILTDGVLVEGNKATGTAGSGGGILNNVGATLDITNARIALNEANRAGGGIEDASGSGSLVTITDSKINDNVVFTAPGNGGGIHIGSDGDLTITNSTVDMNKAGAEGGGIWNGAGTLTVRNTLLRMNQALGDEADQGGGGLYNNGDGTIVLENNVRILDNKATGASGSGGGILNNTGATLTIADSRIAGNEANRAGGGLEDASGSPSMVTITNTDFADNRVNFAPGNGGAVHVGGDGSLTITGGKVSGNSAGQEGGGLWNSVGTMKVTGVEFYENVAEGDDADDGGGALFNNGGTMIVEDAYVHHNLATGAAGSGGGLFSTGGSVTVTGGEFATNQSNRAGGAVEIVDGSYTSMDVVYDGNVTGNAPGNGGAFHVTGMMSTVDFTGGSVINNVAANEGGGLWNQAGTMMSVTSVSILGNTVTNPGTVQTRVAGAGVFNNGGILDIVSSTIANNALTGGGLVGGGGIANNTGGTLTVMQSTVSGNKGGVTGGGVANDGTVEIVNTTITDNTALAGGGYAQATPYATLTITGSIVADNEAIKAPDFASAFSTVNSGGFNLIGTDVLNQFPATDTDKEGMSADLMPLADNGGMTMTHAPNCTSPVIDMGDPDDNGPDQLGQPVFGGTRDIGSFEKQSPCYGTDPALAKQLDRSSEAVLATDQVSVFPNPAANDHLNVIMPRDFEGDVFLRIIGSDGRSHDVKTTQSPRYRLDLSGFSVGAYTLQVTNGAERQTVRFIIAR
ncbi:putative secreted protein (Por secretion system target) [Neolewinella xylanilytica]|uniref:Putative secreted protein (Por secretion system target) n=1 Tax=Neolewinella xylanilytica TaxID=1514080 RepID=A0A2S6I8X4_9BACT|nr:choice-of-anchor Q domain-containing protein [Neolewinella xylanilytica]PPK87950.1 putative secreted protein (Por secretion system target) [Neolewinella xylanilytica]